MQIFNIHEAKTQLSPLVEMAAKGEPFVIAKAGKPMVKVVALNAPEPRQVKRLGFMAGQIAVPDDFDRMGQAEIERCSAAALEAVARHTFAAVGGGRPHPLVGRRPCAD
jgi:prevent-host-death family protein